MRLVSLENTDYLAGALLLSTDPDDSYEDEIIIFD